MTAPNFSLIFILIIIMNEGRFKSRLLTLQARFSQALKGYELTHMDLPLDCHNSYD
jgi:hypothetical protein